MANPEAAETTDIFYLRTDCEIINDWKQGDEGAYGTFSIFLLYSHEQVLVIALRTLLDGNTYVVYLYTKIVRACV